MTPSVLKLKIIPNLLIAPLEVMHIIPAIQTLQSMGGYIAGGVIRLDVLAPRI
jgi:hypothetical protein